MAQRSMPPAKAKALIDFLVRGHPRADAQAEYAKDPDATMKTAGIGDSDRRLIPSGYLNAIRQALGTGVSRIVWQPPTVWQ